MLVWEIVRSNLDAATVSSLPFAPTILGVAPAATLVAAMTTLLLARTQYARVSRPYISGHSKGWIRVRRRRAWTLILQNVGAGVARVRSVRYGIVPAAVEGWLWWPVPEARDNLAMLGLRPGVDFDLHEISPGFAMKPSMGIADGLEMFTLSERGSNALQVFAIQLEFEDQVGDVYIWERDFASVLRLGRA
ncbi:retron-type reverse transcriptase [Microbacterium testaceum StLB037]|uniref:Retron-type reverse transcriptase n=1 Tax=Microbacterium testaceum (strain StLB037) TaxID=979556 RepID=E8N8Y5_MICTS|nr:retron-type reverse transcriptase [Microbacterium testaceum StLB037]